MTQLLILNYCMDLDDPALSHQVEAVNNLASSFSKVTVITGRVGRLSVKENVRVISSNWEPDKPLRNILNLYRVVFPLLKGIDVVFSHMTEVQSFLIGPMTRFRHIPHFLWYAHAHKSFFLSISHKFVDGIITSTSGSCPIEGTKVHIVGQAINPKVFFRKIRFAGEFLNLCHVGRFDSPKNIVEIIEVVHSLRRMNTSLNLTLVGNPSDQKQEQYASDVKSRYFDFVESGWLTFKPSIPRDELPNFLGEQDLFIHAYRGSLDKTLVEATLFGIPVITSNEEYLSEFGRWNKMNLSGSTLLNEAEAFFSVSDIHRNFELERRQKIALESHGLDQWATKISKVLLLSINDK